MPSPASRSISNSRSVSAISSRYPGAARTRSRVWLAAGGNVGSMALDRAGVETHASQYAGDRARQQTCPHRLGRTRARSGLSVKNRTKGNVRGAILFTTVIDNQEMK